MTLKLRQSQVDAVGGPEPCRFGPVERVTPQPGAGPSGASVVIVDSTKTATFIAISLRDARDRPAAGEPFQVLLPDGQPVTGRLDAAGRVRIEGIDPGTCTVTFPELDRQDFRPDTPSSPAQAG